jgi:hypothetical protein
VLSHAFLWLFFTRVPAMKSFRFNPVLTHLDGRIVPDSTATTPITWTDDDTFQVGEMTFDVDLTTDVESTDNTETDNVNLRNPLPAAPPVAPAVPPTLAPVPPLPNNTEFVQPKNPTGITRPKTDTERIQIDKLSDFMLSLKARRLELIQQYDNLGASIKVVDQTIKDNTDSMKRNGTAIIKLKQELSRFGITQESKDRLQFAINALEATNIKLNADNMRLLDFKQRLIADANKLIAEIGRVDLKIREVQGAINSINQNALKGGTPDAVLNSPDDLDPAKLGGQDVVSVLPPKP